MMSWLLMMILILLLLCKGSVQGSLLEISGAKRASTGTPFTLSCAHNTGKVNVTYSWYRAVGVKSVQSSAGDGNELVVDNPQESLYYQCAVTDTDNNVYLSAYYRVEVVNSTVEITKGPDSEGRVRYVVIGVDLELYCEPSAAGAIVKWYFGDERLLSKENVIPTSQGIYIFNLDYEDIGTYRCTAGMFGIVVESESVVVKKNPNGLDQRAQIGYPRKIIEDYTVSVTVSDVTDVQSVTLRFGDAGYPGVKCYWTFFSKELVGAKYTISDYNRSLTIHDVDSTDGGTYIGTCVSSIKALSRVQRSTYISLYVNYLKLVVPSFSYITESEGSQIYLTCGCDGFEIPRITWYRDNKRLLPSKKISELFYAPRSVLSILSIPSVTRETSGLYHCACINKAGLQLAYFKLYVFRRSHCPAESVDTEVGVFWFPETKVGNYVEMKCPYNGRGIGASKVVQRLCNPSKDTVKWTPINYYKCPHPPITKKALVLNSISTSPKTTDWILNSMIERGEKLKGRACDQCAWSGVVASFAELIEQIETVEHLMTDRRFPDSLSPALHWLDTVLQANATLSGNEQDLVYNRLSTIAVELIKLSTDVYTPLHHPSTFTYYTLPVKKMLKHVQLESFQFPNKTIAIQPASKTNNAEKVDPICDVILPEVTVTDMKMRHLSDTLYFVVFSRNITLFGGRKRVVEKGKGNNVQIVGSYRVAAGLLFGSVQDTNVTMEFSTLVKGGGSCVYWNYTGYHGNWSTEGLETRQNGSITSCTTSHFTNFAVLMTLDRRSLAEGLHLKIITLITLVCTTISCIFLVVTIGVLASFRHLRTVTSNRLHINLSISLLFASLVFITCFERLLEHKTPCLVVTLLQHYIWLTVFGWMAAEGLYLYKMVHSVFVTHGGGYVTKLAIVVWGTPAIIVGCVFGYWRDGYVGYNYCWLDNTPMMVGFALPVSCSLAFNLFIFISVLVKSHRRSSYKNYRNNAHKILSKTKGVLTIICLLGITWLFGFLSIKKASLTFQYIFNICTALQGLFLFIFHCLAKHEVRASWSYFIKYGRVMSNQAQIRRGTAQVPTMKPMNRDQGMFSIDGLSATCRAQSMFSERGLSTNAQSISDCSRSTSQIPLNEEVNSNSTQSTSGYSRNPSQSTLSDNSRKASQSTLSDSRKASQEDICIPYNKAQGAPEQEVLQNYILTHLSSLQEEDNEVYSPSPCPEPRRTPISIGSKKQKKATPFLQFTNKGKKNALRSFESCKVPHVSGKLPRDKLAPFSSTPAHLSDSNHSNHSVSNHGIHVNHSSQHVIVGKHGSQVNQVDTTSESSEDFRNVCESALEKKQNGSRVNTTQVMKQLRMRKTSSSSTKMWRGPHAESDEDTEVKMLDLTGNNGAGRTMSLNFNMSANSNHNELSQMTIKEEPDKIFQIIPGSMKRKKVQRKRQGGLRRSNTDY